MGMPMNDDVITIIMGLEDPCEPGMHGEMKAPCPSDDAVGLVTKIRDMCDEWLRSSGKCEGESDKNIAESAPTEVGDIDKEE